MVRPAYPIRVLVSDMLLLLLEWVSKRIRLNSAGGFNWHVGPINLARDTKASRLPLQTDFCASLFRDTFRRIAPDAIEGGGPIAVAELVPTIAWDGLVLSDSLWRRRPTEPRVEFLGRALPTGSVCWRGNRPTATRGVERTADSDDRGQFRLAFVAPGPIDGGGKGVSAEQPRCHNSCRRSRKTRRDAVRAIPLTVVAGVMFRCAAVADPVMTIGGTAVNVLWPESETPY